MSFHDLIKNEMEFEKAISLYESFHERPPRMGKIVGIRQKGTINALEVGPFYGIAYISEGKKYFHKFNANNRPLVFVSADGKQIYILRGGYRFTDRGFIG